MQVDCISRGPNSYLSGTTNKTLDMPGLLLTPDTEFKTLKFKKLHPTFAAEVGGVDFSAPIPDDVFQEILAASAKVASLRVWRASY